MAGMPRESAFMPTVKCSSCGNEVEISLMGEHLCSGAPASDPVPPMPATSLFQKLNPLFSSLSQEKPKPAAPPKVDTSAANQSYAAPGQTSPVSLSSGSRSVSPKTPYEGQETEQPDDFFAPKIANDSPPPQQTRRPGGYGGFGDADGSESAANPPVSPKKQAPSLLERMNTIARGPFDARGKPAARNAFPLSNSPEQTNGFPADRTESSRPARAPRKNGYGGFGPPGKTSGDFNIQPLSPSNRADTFPSPRPSDMPDQPSRTPSAPGPRPDRLRRPSQPAEEMPPMTSDRMRRSSRGPDTTRPPPPRTSLIRPPTSGRDGSHPMPAINLESEFGSGNPYHTPSESMSSNGSSHSHSRSGASTQPSSVSSPPRSMAPQPVRKTSDTSSYDNLMSDLQSSMAEIKPKELTPIIIPPPTIGKDKAFPLSPIGRRPPRPEFGYDPRIHQATQSRMRSPLASPSSPDATSFGGRDDPAIQGGQREDPAIQGGRRDDPADQGGRLDDPAVQAGRRGPAAMGSFPQAAPKITPRLPFPPPEPSSPERHTRSQSGSGSLRSQSRPRDRTNTRSQSRPRDPAVQSSRGNCKSCGDPITGKSISSADGRLTGRYHKACFVCTTCQNPFSSATFYVLDDKPYCELHYHKLNGSLCRSCGNGIEGEYLEDESAKKHHPGCFRCGDCGMALTDGYFEVGGRAYCEKDAWRRVQQPWMVKNNRMGPGPSPMRQQSGARPGGGPGFGGLGVPGGNGRLGPRPRMEKRMTRLGMM